MEINKTVADEGKGTDSVYVTRYYDSSGINKLKQEKKYCEAIQSAQLNIERVLLGKILQDYNDLKIKFITISKAQKKNEIEKWAERFKVKFGENCYLAAKKFIWPYLNEKAFFWQLKDLCHELKTISSEENEDLKSFYEIRNKVIHQHGYLLAALIPNYPEGKLIEQKIIEAIDKSINFLQKYG